MAGQKSNYVQMKVPVENADLVFEALCWQFGMATSETVEVETGKDDDGNPIMEEKTQQLDKETQARAALIGVVNNSVREYRNMQALQKVQDETTDLNIT